MPDDSVSTNAKAPPVPWSGAEMLLALILAWEFWPSVIYLILDLLGVKRWYAAVDPEFGDGRLALWVKVLSAPFQVLTYPLLFAALSNTRPGQLGLTVRRWGRNVLAGVVGLLLLSPAVFGVWALVRWLYGANVEPHPLEKMAPHLCAGEWVLMFLAVTVAAPWHEELTFRGVLQPWLAARPWGGHAAMLSCLAWVIWKPAERLLWGWPRGIADVAAPVLFVLAMLPLYMLVWRCSRTPVAPALFGVSLLFACIHTSVWPTPIPLFVLSLGLGVLARRSQSLVGPIVWHGLFNGYSWLRLLRGG